LRHLNVKRSFGAVDDEKGTRWQVTVEDEHVNGTSYPKLHVEADGGVPVFPHSSVWLRTSTGISPGSPRDEFAKFFFGGFGNNYAAHGEEQRYRESYSFPGFELNEVGGRNYVRGMLEWCLPPAHFARLGVPELYASWLRPEVFASTLVTDLDSAG